MDNLQKIRMGRAVVNMSEADLARKLGISPPALSKRLKSDKFTYAEMEQIAEAMGAKYNSTIEFPDGTKI